MMQRLWFSAGPVLKPVTTIPAQRGLIRLTEQEILWPLPMRSGHWFPLPAIILKQ